MVQRSVWRLPVRCSRRRDGSHVFLECNLARTNQARHSRLQNNRNLSRAGRQIVFALSPASIGAPSGERYVRWILALPDQLRRRPLQLRDASQAMAGDVRKVAGAGAVLRGPELESASLPRLGL